MPKAEPVQREETGTEVKSVHSHQVKKPSYHTLRLVTLVFGILLLASVIFNIAQAIDAHNDTRPEFGRISVSSGDSGPQFSTGGGRGPQSGASGMGMRVMRGVGLDVTDYLKSDGSVDTDKAKTYAADEVDNFQTMTLNRIEEAIKLAKTNGDITSAQAEALLSAFGVSSSTL